MGFLLQMSDKRTNNTIKQCTPTIPISRYSDNPLFRQPTIPTIKIRFQSHYSDTPIFEHLNNSDTFVSPIPTPPIFQHIDLILGFLDHILSLYTYIHTQHIVIGILGCRISGCQVSRYWGVGILQCLNIGVTE